MKIAVQLYSLRDIIKGSGENLLAILPRVKALGYDGVEFAGYFGVDAETLRAALDSAGSSPSVRTSPLRATRPKTSTKQRRFAALSA